jgi:hypothetical protein
MDEYTDTPVKCRYCRAPFEPRTGTGGSSQQFCSAGHRKAFHKYGTVTIQKLAARIKKEVRETMAQEIKEQVRAELWRDLQPLVSEKRLRLTAEAVFKYRIDRAVSNSIFEVLTGIKRR